MRKEIKKFGPLGVSAILLCIALMATVFFNIPPVVQAGNWYEISTDRYLDDPSKWGVSRWHHEEGTGYYWMNNGEQYSYYSRQGGYQWNHNDWGCTAYVQGENPIWGGIEGVKFPYTVPGNVQQRIIWQVYPMQKWNSWLIGAANIFVEVWGETTDGRYFEIMWTINGAWYATNQHIVDGQYEWSFHKERAASLPYYQWSTIYINMNPGINAVAAFMGLHPSQLTIHQVVTNGAEACNGGAEVRSSQFSYQCYM